jgi:lysophospholipid acyltransferase (LPLAT)-like uncharacterized protein
VKRAVERFILLKVAPTLLFITMRLLWFSYKKRYFYIDKPKNGQLIAVSWHGELFITPQVYRDIYKSKKTSAIISKHRDGDFISKVLLFFKILPVRGSTNKGAISAIIESLRVLNRGDNLLITPDGPRGPRHSVNAGAISLAIKKKIPIMVVNFKASSYWQIDSWDRFVIPKPFSRVDIYHQVLDVNNLESIGIDGLKKMMLKYSID